MVSSKPNTEGLNREAYPILRPDPRDEYRMNDIKLWVLIMIMLGVALLLIASLARTGPIFH